MNYTKWNKTMKKYIFRCKKCGSTNIQILAWVNPNTNEVVADNEEKECWCEDCEEHSEYECIETT